MADVDRFAPVQQTSCWFPPRRRTDASRPDGVIAWAEHLEAYAGYSKRYGTDQSAERLAERGGFGMEELRTFLGREPSTWRAR